MMRPSPILVCLAVLLVPLMPVVAWAQGDGEEAAPLVEAIPVASEESFETSDERSLTYLDGLILGLVEGITEYLPVSSTGHLILTNRFLGLDLEQPLYNQAGEPIFLEFNEESGEGVPFTLENAAEAYVIIIQGGAILAVVIIYWGRIWAMAEGVLLFVLMPLAKINPELKERLTTSARAQEGMLLARNLIVAFLPAAVIGLLLNDWIEGMLFGILPVIIALFAGALLMLAVEKVRRGKTTFGDHDAGPDLHELNLRQCVIIGLLQCVAMWPGTSRSMMTIVGGYVVGLNPVRAAEFSFLLGFITLSAAAGYKALSVGPPMLEALDLGPILFGIAVATVSAALAVKWLVAYLTKHGLGLFAWYRVVLALGVVGLFYL